MSPVEPHPDQSERDDERGIADRHAFNEGWGETIAGINRAQELGEWPFTMPRPGWDAQRASDEERAR